jgi:ankyrin repeat protein
MVRLLLEKGADVDAKDKNGETILYRAASIR